MTVPKIKFCGFTKTEDVQIAANLNFNYFGFIIEIPESPRSVNFDKAVELAELAKKISAKKTVAVVKNPSDSFIRQILDSQSFDIIQFHGQKGRESLSSLKGCIEVWKVFNYGKTESNIGSQIYEQGKPGNSLFTEIKIYKGLLDKVLLDLPKDISSTVNLNEEVPKQTFFNQDIFKKLGDLDIPVILAGKLTSENVFERTKVFDFYGVDLASGVEVSPGKKDYQKMVNFINQVEKLRVN